MKAHPIFDWFFVGLHFHNEHHVFPKMPRQQLRFISKDIRKLTEKHGIEYRSDYWWVVLNKVRKHLRNVAKAYYKY